MLPQDRQSEIMKQLHEFKTVKILELSRELNVTRETIRKDLPQIFKVYIVMRLKGGTSIQTTYYI
ncbi:DeoR family transcriptional regulator [Peribacillus sp. NJ11]|uniref:DeoR family transcriptional regulator n=1 Tax=unclassified Peribacillus TaxID=2675266 RepID=UPI0025A05823|nr:DeoR family transcriptional regulator [Peribacillus sp. NJ11]MDM5224514.1 DeoR family transcriptional regulator [Peribacillus sp. NJ11]